MKLYELYGSKGFHTCIATTFGVDFGAYESIVLPRLRGAGCFNNVLMADARMLTYALDSASPLPQHAGRHYTVAGVTPEGVFHPKVTLQLGRRSGRLIVASANMTAAGLAGNLELAGQVDCDAGESGERRLLAATWQYLRGLAGDGQQGLDHQLEWLRPRTPWLFDTEPAAGPVALADGTDAAILLSGIAQGIGQSFTALVEERPVKRLILISPYWDPDLQALKFLIRALQPRETLILIDSGKALFPVKAAARLQKTNLFELEDFGKGRFVHAKAIIAETAKADHVLYGSANCTVAALGTDRAPGSNEEACFYRRLRRNTVVESLGLTYVLDTANRLDASMLPPYAAEESLPLEEASLRAPGRFECLFGSLAWWPTASGGEPDAIELLDAQGETLPVSLTPLPGAVPPRRYQISATEGIPAFARLRFPDGTVSAPAIVTVVDKLRETVRDARSKRAESAVIQLSAETEEGLWLWELMDELETAAAHSGSDDPGTRSARDRKDETEGQGRYRTLDYVQFIAGRRLRSDDPGVTRSSLAGSDLTLVRDFLNRILSLGGGAESGDQIDDEALAQGLDLGDETDNAADALEGGAEFSRQPADGTSTEEDAARRRAAPERATREQIISAVERFNAHIKSQAEAGQLTSFDVLRFRAILMIVAAAGAPCGTSSPKTALQVLPCDDGAEAWPRLMGRLAFTLFGGNHPAIRNLQIEAIHDCMPDDLLECWATALWSVQACIAAAAAHNGLQRNIGAILTTLVQQTYVRTGLRRNEMESGRIEAVFESLNARFAARLGLDSLLITKAHMRTIDALFTPSVTA